MNERIKLIRKDFNMNQEEMGNKLGVTKSTISRIEKGITNITEHMIKSICREFNINEEWLRNGTGEMFIKTSNELLEQLAAKYNLKDFEKQAFETLLTLEEKDREKISNLIKNLFNDGFFDFNKDNEVTATKELDEDPIESEVAAYKQELVAESKGEIYSASENSKDEKNLA